MKYNGKSIAAGDVLWVFRVAGDWTPWTVSDWSPSTGGIYGRYWDGTYTSLPPGALWDVPIALRPTRYVVYNDGYCCVVDGHADIQDHVDTAKERLTRCHPTFAVRITSWKR